MSELNLNRLSEEKVYDIDAKNVKQTPSDRGVEKARKYLKDNGLLAVPFDKGVGFWAIKKKHMRRN